MKKLSLSFYVTAAALVIFLSPALVLSEAEPESLVQNLADGVYLFVWGGTKSLFVVSEEGVIVTDPQKASVAERYLKEIRKITDKPVKYVIYSHRHNDHIAGGKVFQGEAIFVSHETAHRRLARMGNPDVVLPTLTFTRELTIHLGEKTVKVLFLGKSETDDNCFIYLPEEKILFAVDSIGNRSVGWWGSYQYGYVQEWVKTLKRVEKLDFDILALSHGKPGTKETVREYRGYLTDLIAEVKKYVDQGISLEETRKRLRLPKYQRWRFYDFHFPLNVEKVYTELEGD